MNNTNGTARLASEKQTAFIAKLSQSIPWDAITMHEASSTIRALLKLRDAHKPAEEAKAGKKERSKEKNYYTKGNNHYEKR